MDEQSINCCIIFKLGLVVDRTQTHLKRRRRRRRNHKGFFFKMYKYVNTTFVSVCFYYYYLLSNTQLILLPLSLYSLYKYRLYELYNTGKTIPTYTNTHFDLSCLCRVNACQRYY